MRSRSLALAGAFVVAPLPFYAGQGGAGDAQVGAVRSPERPVLVLRTDSPDWDEFTAIQELRARLGPLPGQSSGSLGGVYTYTVERRRRGRPCRLASLSSVFSARRLPGVRIGRFALRIGDERHPYVARGRSRATVTGTAGGGSLSVPVRWYVGGEGDEDGTFALATIGLPAAVAPEQPRRHVLATVTALPQGGDPCEPRLRRRSRRVVIRAVSHIGLRVTAPEERAPPPAPPPTTDLLRAGFLRVGQPGVEGVGRSVAGAGDVNRDGRDDVILAGPDPGGGGSAYVVFGAADHRTPLLSALGARGLRIDAGRAEVSGVDGAGDMNGDGYSDVVVGRWALRGGSDRGAAFVVFGRESPEPVDLSNLGAQGFAILGTDRCGAGAEVAGAGDVNGDGAPDVVVATSECEGGASHAYVVFGSSSSGAVDLRNLGLRGFAVRLPPARESGKVGVAPAGDLNEDGLADVIIGSEPAGRAYVVYGRSAPADLDARALGDAGFVVNGRRCARPGEHVDGGGDVNGDGHDDLVVGAASDCEPDPLGRTAAHVLFGSGAAGVPSLAGDGYRIELPKAVTGLTYEGGEAPVVALVEDRTGDGRDEVVVATTDVDFADTSGPGVVYLVHGQTSSVPLYLDSLADRGQRFVGVGYQASAGESVDDAGDFDGDGWRDLVIGAPGEDFATVDDGAVHITVALAGEPGACAATIAGGPGRDRLVGTDAGDRLEGHGGADGLSGLWGDDCLVGSAGRDRLDAGYGVDRIDAGPGRDVVRTVGEAPDVIDCGPGKDVAYVSRRDLTRRCERIFRRETDVARR